MSASGGVDLFHWLSSKHSGYEAGGPNLADRWPAWHPDAACIGKPGDWWFPPAGERSGSAYKKARPICEDCLVREVCLAAAIERNDKHGMWGGKTPRERRRLRTPKKATHGVRSTYRDGCHCDLCVEANAEYKRAWRANREAAA